MGDRSAWAAGWWMVSLMLLAPACGGSASPSTAPVERCTKAGQRCVYSAGKIGLCMGTKTGGLLCTSQH